VDLYNLSLYKSLNYSNTIISYILSFIFAAVILKLILNSQNLNEFLMNLGLLLLALLNLAFFAMIYAMIFGGLVLPVLGLILNIFDLDVGLLKMDSSAANMNPQPNQGPQGGGLILNRTIILLLFLKITIE
jgi:hypothetical protein